MTTTSKANTNTFTLHTLTLVLVRHGQTDYNAQGRYQGSRDIPLNEVGRAQANRVAARLARRWGHDLPLPIAVYSSDLSRAHETAHLLRQAIPDLPEIVPLATLRERDYAGWEGLTLAEIAEQFQSIAHHPDAETDAALWARMATALITLWEETAQQATEPNATVLVVGHGSALRVWLGLAVGGGPEMLPRFALDNACVSMVEFTRGNDDGLPLVGRLLRVNDTVAED